MAMFTQQNTVVSPLFESLIWLRSHRDQLFIFYNQTHTCTFSGLTTAFSENPHCVNGSWLDHYLSLTSYSAREPLCATQRRVYCLLWGFVCGFAFSKLQQWIYDLCHLKVLDSVTVLHRSGSCQFCDSKSLLSTYSRYKSCCRLMKIWQTNSQLNWTLVMSKVILFSFMDVVIFVITLVTVTIVTGKRTLDWLPLQVHTDLIRDACGCLNVVVVVSCCLNGQSQKLSVWM